MISRQGRTHLNPGPASALQPAPQFQPVPRRRRKPPNPLVMPWILPKDKKKGCYSNLLANLIHNGIPGYQNFVRMLPSDLIEEPIHHHIKKSVTNFRKPLEVGLKLAITLGHLATGETWTSLQYHWLVCLCAASPGRRRIEIPLGQCGVKWIFIRCTVCQQK